MAKDRLVLRVEQRLHFEIDLEVGTDIEAASAASLKLMDGKCGFHLNPKEGSILAECLNKATPYLSEYEDIEVTEI